MVKRPRIASKPTKSDPDPDDWVKSGGVDPEIQLAFPAVEPQQPADKGKTYPHRISFDTDTLQYKRLKRSAFEEERAMNEILREAVENWLKEHGY